MRAYLLAAVAAAFVGAGAVQAQPAKKEAPVKAAEPTVELRVRSLNDLLDKAEVVGAIAGQEELFKGVKALLKVLTREKTGLEGLNTKLPFGFYADLSVDLVNSPAIIMIPIADEKRFLEMLKSRLDVDTEKAEEGTYKASVPIVNELYLRFADGYLYVGRSVQALNPKVLIAPKTFFAKDDGALASLIVRFEGIPKEVKDFIFGQFEFTVKEQRQKNGPNEDPIQRIFLDWFGDAITDGLNTLFGDAKELGLRVFIDEKTQELSAEASLTAKKGSTLSKTIASFASKSSVPASIVAVKDPVVQASAKAGLTPDLKKRFDAVVDKAAAEVEKIVDPNAMAVVRQALDAIIPTLKAADLDLAFSLSGPNAKGHHTLLVAASVKKGKEIEKLLKEVSNFAGGAADFDFDREKIGDFNLHKITLNDGPPQLEDVFGTKTFWVAISDSCIALSVEPDGVAIKAGLKAKVARSAPSSASKFPRPGCFPSSRATSNRTR